MPTAATERALRGLCITPFVAVRLFKTCAQLQELQYGALCAKLRSGRRLRSSGQDRISALPDDLLRLVLARIGYARAAARTSVLSRRWRGLLLPGLVLRGVAFHKLEAALGRVSPELRASRVSSLLRAAVRLAPEEFVLALPVESTRNTYDVELPSFHRATSIVLDVLFFFKVPAGVEFPVLETLSLTGCMVDLNALLPCCPCLRVLRIKLTKFWTKGMDLTVHSASLQELVVKNKWMRNVDIVAPSLKQLTMSMISYIDKNISVMAPMMEKVSWQCLYGRVSGVREACFGLWCLDKLRLQTAERQGQPTSLHIHAYTDKRSYRLLNKVDSCAIQKHIVDAFSVLELHLETAGHVFGAFVFHLIEMNCIHSAMQRLKVVLQRSMKDA
ncbi:F-box/LRR-repeat protein At3g03360-like [Triticum dicoccoides]|uniref:F-box/LRR-repeat protein At3g03360-like n=1 Tax=Triticum dicoccoides TaxID=85692 RepID=UPI0018914621|nr:F-box/LRR-repeat protein At3g03360-like [Triticum dicoccoides]